MVWTHYNGSHGWLPQYTKISKGMSIICLSFCYDGSLLAVGVAGSLRPSIKTLHTNANDEDSIDKIHLYETSNWTCTHILNLNSPLGLCGFLKSKILAPSDYNFNEVNSKKKANANFLLVFTNDGSQIHLIPNFNVPINEDFLKQNVSKSVRWADSSNNTIEEIIDFEVNSKKSIQKPIWNNSTTKIQVSNCKDDNAKNIKTHSLRLKGGRRNAHTLEFKNKWSIYNAIKNETQEQLKKCDGQKCFCQLENEENGIENDFAKYIDSNKSLENKNICNIKNDISINTINHLQYNGNEAQLCQTYTSKLLLGKLKTKYCIKDKINPDQCYDAKKLKRESKSSSCERIINLNNNTIKENNENHTNVTRHTLNGVYNSMMTEAWPPDCKPLLHRMAVGIGPAFHRPGSTPNPHQPTACYLHANPPSNPSAPPCPVHGGCQPPHSMTFTTPYDESSLKTSIAGSPHHRHYEADFSEEDGNGKSLFRDRREDGKKCSRREAPHEKENENDDDDEEEELKKACEKLCEQMRWKSEKQYQEVSRSSFQEIGQCQAALHALHDKSRERDLRGAVTEAVHETNRHDGYRWSRGDRDHLSLGQSQSSFSDATFLRPFRECCTERLVSAPIHERIITSPGRRSSRVPEELLQRYSESARPHVLKGLNVASKGVSRLHPSPSLRNERLRSISVDQKRPRFCTGLKRGKGETEDASAKEMLNVVPVVMLHRDKTKGVWNRKANQEWDHGHRGCCSQRWISVLDNNDKVVRADGRKALSARASVSPIPRGRFAAMATQKLKDQGERCRSLVARSLDLSSSPFSSLKAIVHEMSRPQSAGLPKRCYGFSTPRSASTCKGGQKQSVAITPARKMINPELNSSAWLLAEMEALRNETFTEPKALQIAKEHGIVLDKEDEAVLKKFLLSNQSDRALDAAELEGDKTRERKLKKQLSPKAQAARIRECCKNSKSDPVATSDHNSQGIRFFRFLPLTRNQDSKILILGTD